MKDGDEISIIPAVAGRISIWPTFPNDTAGRCVLPVSAKTASAGSMASRVTLSAAAALGTVLANSLVRAGVGHLRLIDRDFIETNNLQRQILFDEDDVAASLPKAEAAARKLRRINSTVDIEPVVVDVDRTNILELAGDADIILDGSDNFEVRYIINDAAVKLNKPWVYGGCIGSYGQIDDHHSRRDAVPPLCV